MGIDAPEMKQSFGYKSKQCLANLINNNSVQIISFGEDRFNRTLAKILIEKIDINLAMIKQGCAWFYRRYKNTLDKNDQIIYDQAEIFAIKNKKGLFSNHKHKPHGIGEKRIEQFFLLLINKIKWSF